MHHRFSGQERELEEVDFIEKLPGKLTMLLLCCYLVVTWYALLVHPANSD
jgi:hypothetical protein